MMLRTKNDPIQNFIPSRSAPFDRLKTTPANRLSRFNPVSSQPRCTSHRGFFIAFNTLPLSLALSLSKWRKGREEKPF